jgi:flagellar motor switch protein FliG
VDPQEQQRIIRDFVAHQPRSTVPHQSAVELDPSLVEKLQARLGQAEPNPPRDNAGHSGTLFGFLDHIDAADLAQVLVREHPQTAAIVISHLAPARAAGVLRQLPNSLQTEALIRIARLKSLATDVVHDIEHEMQALLQNRRQLEPVVPDGLAAIQAILQATSQLERQTLLSELARQDQTLAQYFGEALPHNELPHPPRTDWPSVPESADGLPIRPTALRTVMFADLERLEDAALAQVLHLSSPNTAILALAGASHEFVARILQQLPAREAGKLERKMQQLGPIRLDDVERAQMRLAEVAQRLIDEGRIALPQVERFAVAA